MKEIKKEHILSAIHEIDKEGIRPGRTSSTYDLIYNGKSYPPKLVISIANRFATGVELDHKIFSGGVDTPAFQLLKKEGFDIVNKGAVIGDPINIKDEFATWLIVNDGKKSNYFSKQFGSKKERLIEELELYELKYKENFGIELFEINAKNFTNEIRIIKTNIYNKTSEFSKFSENRSNDRPRAILGNNNYLDFLNDYFTTQNTMENSSNFKTFPLNQILYGPPGTGKTYVTKELAVNIINPIFKKELDLQLSTTDIRKAISKLLIVKANSSKFNSIPE